MITLTEKAIKEIRHIVVDQGLTLDDVALRIRVTGGGCSGFQNKLDLDENFDDQKDVLLMQDGIRIAVDKRSALYVQGATVDFHDSLEKRGFVVNNPNARGTCGCGQSFQM